MEIISKSDWGAAPEPARPRMPLPARELWLHHTVTDPSDDPHADMRAVQRIGVERFGYVSYSYCIHPSGMILEGQGTNVGAHTRRRNSTGFGVAWIGNYEHLQPTDAQIAATRWLIGHLVDTGALAPGVYPTGGHKDVPQAATACPGRKAHALLSRLRHPWSAPADLPEGVVVVNAPVVAVLVHPDGGYLQVGTDGGIFAFGQAPFFGSLGDVKLRAAVSGAAWTPSHQGYWLCGQDGGVFAFGDAHHHGSLADRNLNKPVVGMGATAQGGYFLVGGDGGIFAFGPGAKYHGNVLSA